MTDKLNLWTARFQDSRIEEAYQIHQLQKSMKMDRVALALGGFLFAVYGFMDLIALEYGVLAFYLRMTGAILILTVAYFYRYEILAKYFEILTTVLILITGSILNFMIWIEGDPTVPYYVGLIHVSIYCSVVLRTGVMNAVLSHIFVLMGYVLATWDILPSSYYYLSLYFLTLTFITCIAGVYYIDRMRRLDYTKYRHVAQARETIEGLYNQEREEGRRKTALINIIGHYVRTPVHQIKGYGDMITHEAHGPMLVPEYREYMSEIQQATDDLKRFTDRILNYHRLGAKNLEQTSVISHLSDLLENAVGYAEAHCDVVIEIVPAKVFGNSKLISAAFEEIIANIIEHASQTQVIRITSHLDSDFVVVCFVDQGPGMSAEQVERLTTPVEEITDYLSEGAKFSLGLRYARRIVEMFKGQLLLSEVEGGGVLATIRLPLYGRAEVVTVVPDSKIFGA